MLSCKHCKKELKTWKDLKHHIDRRHERRDVRQKSLDAFEADLAKMGITLDEKLVP